MVCVIPLLQIGQRLKTNLTIAGIVNMNKTYYDTKKVRSVEIKKYYTQEGSTITKEHYTKFNEHPEDRIFRDREYIQRLQRHIDSVYELLDNDLKLSESGSDWLFDYVYNEDNKDIEFEEYLEKYNVKYEDIVTSNKWYHQQ